MESKLSDPRRLSNKRKYDMDYVELDSNKCEGMVHVKDIEDDKYLYNTDEQMLIGRATNKKFQLGDKITIKVKKADLVKKHLDFTII